MSSTVDAGANDDDMDRMMECAFGALQEREARPSVTTRYQVLGEIARGGMGVVLKGLDSELGRPVALKMLHDRWLSDDSLRARFVEEAQIGGQLQHPGVVPVYELGKSDGRPFIAMKLVEGRTLRALLAERSDPSVDRRRFLGIFEQVCHTVAYAHARRVIHRDLKPTNVMVGSFGEVHVVDWGLAKVLGSKSVARSDETGVWTVRTEQDTSGSTPGSVLGTPAYMPPEQAQGKVDELDERSDVFALGALLCEILTGEPPYRGESAREMLEQAARGRIEDAFARLDCSGADGELVALAREALAPDPAGRPRNAGALAVRVTAYLASVEERAQAERVAAAEERVKAMAARRAQKLTAALSGSIVLTVVLGAIGWWWIESERAERAERAAGAVARALSEAERLHGEARTAADGEPGAWARAAQAANAARAIASTDDVEAPLRKEVEALSAAIAAGEAEAVERKRRVDADRRMVALIESIPTPDDAQIEVEPDVLLDARRRATAYAEAFRGHGIDVEALDGAEASAQIRSSAIAVHLAAAVDDWALALMMGQSADESRWRRLVAIARDGDDDQHRRAIREALVSGGADSMVARLRAVYPQADERSLPAVTFLVLGRLLYNLGAWEDGISVLKRGFELHPQDFSLAYEIGLALEKMKPVRTAEAVRYLTAARSLRPANHDAALRLALALDHTGQSVEAARILEEACLARPDSGALKLTRAMCLYKLGRLDEALPLCQEANRLRPDYSFGLGLLGQIHIALRQHGKAEAAYREELRLNPQSAMAHINLGIALYELGRHDEGIAELQRGRALDPSIAGVHNNIGYTLEQRGRVLEALDCYRQAAQLDPRFYVAQFNLGRLLRGQRRYQESLRALEAASALGHQDAAKWASDVRAEIARLEKRHASLGRGEGPSPDAAEQVRLAKLCFERGFASEAAGYFRAAFLADPAQAQNLESLSLHDAAQAALQAGGEAWRRQAREWLAAELDLWAARMQPGPEDARAFARERIGRWLTEPELAPARDGQALEQLPETERREWEALWARAEALSKGP